jgi:hypothetical protein
MNLLSHRDLAANPSLSLILKDFSERFGQLLPLSEDTEPRPETTFPITEETQSPTQPQ